MIPSVLLCVSLLLGMGWKMYGLKRDLRDRKQAEIDLKKAHKALEQKALERTKELSVANEKLLDQKELLRNTIESLSYPFYVVSAEDYKIKITNSAFTDSRSITDDATCYQIRHGYDKPCDSYGMQCPVKEVKCTKKPAIVACRYLDKNQGERIYEVHGHPMFDENGEVCHVIIYSIDITELKAIDIELQNALQESQQHIRGEMALLEAAKVVLEYRDFKKASKMIFEKAKEITGAASGYVALLNKEGINNEIVFLDSGGRSCKVDPKLPMPVRGLRGQVYFEREVAFENDFSNSQWMRLMPDGHVGLDNVIFAPLVIGEDTVGLMGLANKPDGFNENDIRLVKGFGEIAAVALQNSRTLESLEESEQRFRAVAETAKEAIISIDGCERVVFWNEGAKDIFGYSSAEILGKSLTLIIPEYSRNMHRKAVQRLFSECEPDIIGKTVELTGLRADAVEIPIELSLAKWKTGEAVFITAIIRDITERKDAEALVQKHQAELMHVSRINTIGEMASSLGHELNQPLCAMLSFANASLRTIKSKNPDHKVIAGDLEAIVKQTKRAGKIANRIKNFIGKQAIHRSTSSINQIVKEAVCFVAADIKQNQFTLNLDLDEDICEVLADGVQIEQVVLNLILNAIESMSGLKRAKHYLIIKTTLDDNNNVEVSVSDTGGGIPEELKERIFDSFFTTKNDGLGIGLSICRTIIESHNGQLTGENNLECGATFKFKLPFA